jgi:uncharacterized metal-binding protein YceD (DUF177 family)
MPARPPAPPPGRTPARPAAPASPDAPPTTPTPARLRTGALSRRRPTTFLRRPDAAGRRALAATLGVGAIDALDFAGEIHPERGEDLRLEGRLRAVVVQPCVVTLAPVTTRIDVTVTRRYRADWAPPTAEEVEMPEDDSEEGLPETLDLDAVLAEALALALPEWPRAEGAEFGAAEFGAGAGAGAGPGAAPSGAEADRDGGGADPAPGEGARRPFAALAALRARLAPPGDAPEPAPSPAAAPPADPAPDPSGGTDEG